MRIEMRRQMKHWLLFVWCAGLVVTDPARAEIKVLATVPDLGSIVKKVGGDAVSVDIIAKGTQDPHYIEAKPSFMVKASRADLVVSIGLDLEEAWLPSIIRGARNSAIQPGSSGYLEVGPMLEPIEIPTGKLTRADGDVHPMGNPHVLLDPVRAGKAARIIADRLGSLDPAKKAEFEKRASEFDSTLVSHTAQWKARLQATGIKRVITYHRTFSYFLNRFGIESSGMLEPKPGVPPTSGHVLSIIETIKRDRVSLILVENYFDPSVTRKIQQEVAGVRVGVPPVAVDGAPGVVDSIQLYESIVRAFESKPGQTP